MQILHPFTPQHVRAVCECVHTSDLAVNWSRDAGQSSGELKEDVVDRVVRQRTHVLSQKFQRARVRVWITHEINGEGVPRC